MLVETFRPEQVFKDVDNIEPGEDFVERITTAVGSCDVLLVLIGERWLTITDESGQRRLDNPEDYVRLEIETALNRKIRVIPILVDNAQMPHASELPPALASLVRRNAVEINPSTFDTKRLIATVRKVLAEPKVSETTRGTASPPSTARPDRSNPQVTVADVEKLNDQALGALPKLRTLVAVILVLIFVGSLLLLIFGWPLQVLVAVILIVLATVSAAAYAAYFVPNKLSERFKLASTAGVAAVGLITALIVVPATQNAVPPSVQELPDGQADPLTATLDFDSPCEDFTIPESSLQSIPPGDGLNAKWVYERGGATRTGGQLTVQGKNEEAVVLQGLRVVELESNPRPAGLIAILPCGPTGGIVLPRYFDVILSNPPQVIARSGEPEPGSEKRGEPAVKFPFKVSATDPEVFILEIKGPPCLCAWRLALDWTSIGRSGTVVVDRGFDKIRTDTTPSEDLPLYSRSENGTWEKL